MPPTSRPATGAAQAERSAQRRTAPSQAPKAQSVAGAATSSDAAKENALVDDPQVPQQRSPPLQACLRQTEDALLDMHEECKVAKAALQIERDALRQTHQSSLVLQQHVRNQTRERAACERVLLLEVATLEREWEREMREGHSARLHAAAGEAVRGMHEAQAECRWLHDQLQAVLRDADESGGARGVGGGGVGVGGGVGRGGDGVGTGCAGRGASRGDHGTRSVALALREATGGGGGGGGGAGAATDADEGGTASMRADFVRAVQRCHELQNHVAAVAEHDASVRPRLLRAHERIVAQQLEIDKLREALRVRARAGVRPAPERVASHGARASLHGASAVATPAPSSSRGWASAAADGWQAGGGGAGRAPPAELTSPPLAGGPATTNTTPGGVGSWTGAPRGACSRPAGARPSDPSEWRSGLGSASGRGLSTPGPPATTRYASTGAPTEAEGLRGELARAHAQIERLEAELLERTKAHQSDLDEVSSHEPRGDGEDRFGPRGSPRRWSLARRTLPQWHGMEAGNIEPGGREPRGDGAKCRPLPTLALPSMVDRLLDCNTCLGRCAAHSARRRRALARCRASGNGCARSTACDSTTCRRSISSSSSCVNGPGGTHHHRARRTRRARRSGTHRRRAQPQGRRAGPWPTDDSDLRPRR